MSSRIILVTTLSFIFVGCSEVRETDSNCHRSLSEFKLGEFQRIPREEVAIYNPNSADDNNAQMIVSIGGFFILKHEVTVSQFQEFVKETGYVTDAEKDIAEGMTGGSSVFRYGTEKDEPKWAFDEHANWRIFDETQNSLSNHFPVVHVSLNDARAYATWAGGRLPTALEWEYTSSLGLSDPSNPFSGAYDDKLRPIANTWQGLFPVLNTAEDGFSAVAPVACFEADEIGLYDMIGNVWEWTDTSANRDQHVIKGGSFLCAENFCKSYKPSSWQTQDTNFSSNHIGFRIVKDVD